jgi:modulator of FtsH protease
MLASSLSKSPSVTSSSVMRNTYWLLAISMLPTILGAYLGVTLGLPAISGLGIFLIFIVMIGFIFAIQALRNSVAGIPVLLIFTGLMGAMLSPILTHTLKYSNGPSLIMLAVGGTAAIFGSLAAYASVTKTDYSGMGKYLFIALIALLVAGIANIFLHLTLLTVAFSAVAIVIFSLYIVYDVQQIVNGGETSYISATLSLYLDIINIFQNLLQLLGLGFGNDD